MRQVIILVSSGSSKIVGSGGTVSIIISSVRSVRSRSSKRRIESVRLYLLLLPIQRW